MICVQAVNDVLQVVNLAAGESCPYISLYDSSDFANPDGVLTLANVASLAGAAAGLYGLVFVIKLVLSQLGFR